MSARRLSRWHTVAILAACLLLALLGATQQFVELRDTEKAMPWIAAFLSQALSWFALAPLALVLLALVRRLPLEGPRTPGRLAVYTLASLGFGALFLAVSVPVRHLFHPAPVVWSFFGTPFYKSAPQWALLGVGAFWAVLLASLYLDARRRLVERVETPESEGATSMAPARIAIETRSGRAVLDPASVTHITAEPGGARVHAADSDIHARATLLRLERELAAFGLVRIHRSTLVNPAHIREVVGSRHRDGSVRLATGQTLPVSRRRWDALGELAPGADPSPTTSAS